MYMQAGVRAMWFAHVSMPRNPLVPSLVLLEATPGAVALQKEGLTQPVLALQGVGAD